MQNEFAGVLISVDKQGNGPRLMIRDLESGRVAYFDALELSSLCYWRDDKRADLLAVGAYELASGLLTGDE